jgi:hypothetical protein
MSEAINWNASESDIRTINKITDRAVAIAASRGDCLDRASLMMDVTACHLNGNPLKLEALSEADDFNFIHDVYGICNHIDRESGHLRDCFSPRFSVPEGES